jgi:ubiquitin-conjugating enzyme E2 Q
LNEIVNAPGEFVRDNPHLVIGNVDWIQTRYLFVETQEKTLSSTAAEIPKCPIPQDPKWTPIGSSNGIKTPLQIPSSEITQIQSQEHQSDDDSPTKSEGSGRKHPRHNDGNVSGRTLRSRPKSSRFTTQECESDDCDSIDTDVEDLNFLFGSDHAQKMESSSESAAKRICLATTDFIPGSLDLSTLPMMGSPVYATPVATRTLQRELKTILQLQNAQPQAELGWYISPQSVENVYQWILEMHSFDKSLPLAQDLKNANLKSVVMEIRFGKDYPISPPFIRVIRPKFLPFASGGGGHVTAGGALCMEVCYTGYMAKTSALIFNMLFC